MFLTEKKRNINILLWNTQVQVYFTLNDFFPIGTYNSPGATGKSGAAILRMPIDTTIQQFFTMKMAYPKYKESPLLLE